MFKLNKFVLFVKYIIELVNWKLVNMFYMFYNKLNENELEFFNLVLKIKENKNFKYIRF